MFNLFPPFGATTAIFNDAPQPWQVGFQDNASPIIIYSTTLAFVLSIPVFISCKDTYREKQNKQLNIVANVLICISIICIYYLVSIYLGVGPIECAPEHDHQLELLKNTNESITKNTGAAFAAYTGMLTMVAGSILKAKAASPARESLLVRQSWEVTVFAECWMQVIKCTSQI